MNLVYNIMMNEYFSAIEVHLESKCDIDSTGRKSHSSSPSKIISIGLEGMAFLTDLQNQEQRRIQLPDGPTYTAIALHPSGKKCALGSKTSEGVSSIVELNFEDNSKNTICSDIATIFQLRYSPSGRYLAAATQQSKAIIIEESTHKKQKCRPGHLLGVTSICFSWDQLFILSISKDQQALVYRLDEGEQPQEDSRAKMTTANAEGMMGSWHFQRYIAYLPGYNQLQTLELINTKWEQSRKSAFTHPSPIIITQTIRSNLLLTSTASTMHIWSLPSSEQLVVLDNFYLTKCVPVGGTFSGVNGDGKVYTYKRELKDEQTKQQEKMDIQENQNSQSRIDFEAGQPFKEGGEENQQEVEQEEKEERQQKIKFISSRKSKADKLITCFPQPPITTFTQFSSNSRFLHIGVTTLLIQHQQSEDENTIELETYSSPHRRILFRNQPSIAAFDVNANGVGWCSDGEYGLKGEGGESWMKKGDEMQGVALGMNWIAFVSREEILIVDLAGHQIRAISFDRHLVAVRAYQNLLVVVYHESVPIDGSQCLAMSLFVVDCPTSSVLAISTSHVPLTPHSILKSLHFSSEGMLFSQDSTGQLRSYSLQTNEWSRVYMKNMSDSKRVWVIGIRNYVVEYWKTTDLEPEPTVSPRLNVKTAELVMASCIEDEGESDLYPSLLWERYCLDHQKGRARLWGRYKYSRLESHPFYQQTSTIMTPEQITAKHNALDLKFFPIIKLSLSNNQSYRALSLVKSQIRSISVGKSYIDFFDDFKMRGLAVELEYYYDEKEKEGQYEQMQIFALQNLRKEAERNIKPKNSGNFLNKMGEKKMIESIPSLSQNSSQQMSFESLSERSYQSQQNVQKEVNKGRDMIKSTSKQSSNALQNPFLKRKPTHQSIDAKKKEIQDQVQAFGLRKKVQKRNGK